MARKRVLLAAPRSFCAGVDRAIAIVEHLLAEHGPPIYVRHQIVHNEHVVRRLEGIGAVFVDSEDEIPPGEICVLSAHGVAPAVRESCERRGLRVVDAVCLLVSKVHAEARRSLVIGSQTSSNAQRLVEVARNAGAEALLIEDDDALEAAMVEGHEAIGLTAGASTPEELVQATVARLAALGWGELQEVTV